MTDTSSFIPNQVATSSDCIYTLKPSSVRARSYRASIAPTNKSNFQPGDQIIFYVPGGRRNTFLDTQQSYFRYTVQNVDLTNSLWFDNCGASVINRLDVFHGSNAIETIQTYNILYNYIVDFQINSANKNGLSSMYGTSQSSGSAGQARQGLGINVATAGTPIKATVCMPILSAVVGVGLDKMLPIGELSDDIRLEFTVESNAIGMVSATAAYAGGYVAGYNTSWTILNAELELTIIELSDEGMGQVRSQTPFSNPVYLHGNSWRHYNSTLPVASAGQYSTLVPARFASLKTLVVLPRRANELVANGYSTSSRINPLISQYWWRVGSYLLPQKPVNLINSNTTGGYAEGFAEVQKSWHSLNHAEYASSMTYSTYNTGDVADTTCGITAPAASALNSYQNGFAIAQELETFAQRSDVMLSGMNTLSYQIFFEANIFASLSAAYSLDFFANYDIILCIENGLISAKF